MITPSFSLTATERVLPKLALDFTTANLDPRVTITRTTGTSNPATYVNSNGVVTAATDNQPRFDYDPLTGICKGLLIEESRTNDLFPSGSINTGWTTQNATINATPITAPDGTSTAYKFVENTANSTHRLSPAVMSWVNGTRYSISFFAKAAGRTSFVLFDGSVAGANVAVFDLAAKTAVIGFSTGSNTCSIKEYKDGWFLCTYTQTSALTNAASAYFFRIDLRSGFVTTYTGDGVSGLYVWGGQRETGAFATSYIPTTSAALTRNADVATMTGTNFSDWFNASEGTFVALSANMVAGGYSRALQVSDNTTSNFINVTTTLCQIRAAGTFYASFSSGGSVAGQFYQTTVAYKTNDCSSSTDGAAIQADATVTLPTVNQMVIGGQTTTNVGSGWIKKIMYWPSRLTNSEVRAFSKQG